MSKSLHIREVPDEIHGALVERAKTSGTSLRGYIVELLADHVSRPTMDEWLATVAELDETDPCYSGAEAVRRSRNDRRRARR